MAQNTIPGRLTDLFSFTELIAIGLAALEAELGIVHNTAAAVRGDLVALQTAWDQCNQAREAKRLLIQAQTAADLDGRTFILAARNVLATFLGNVWSQAWEATGFPNQSLAVPSTIAERQSLLLSLKLYFAAHPTHTVAALNVTSIRATILFNLLSNARAAVNAGLTLIGEKMAVRETAERALRKRLSDTIAELAMKLGKFDPRWETFGLKMPGQDSVCESAEKPVVTNVGPGRVFSDWSDVPGADGYIVEVQVMGVDADFVEVANVSDSEYLLQGLPSGKTIRVRIIAYNAVGRAPPSEYAEIVVE